jgi:hypothetical protein
MDNLIWVLDILPFWRYAVGPSGPHSAAIPFYRREQAEQLFEEAKRALPWSGVILYRRRYWRGIEVVKEYRPSAHRPQSLA